MFFFFFSKSVDSGALVRRPWGMPGQIPVVSLHQQAGLTVLNKLQRIHRTFIVSSRALSLRECRFQTCVTANNKIDNANMRCDGEIANDCETSETRNSRREQENVREKGEQKKKKRSRNLFVQGAFCLYHPSASFFPNIHRNSGVGDSSERPAAG